MAQDGGVDPHNIAVAHGFLDRFRGRPESSCILEVPDRIERSIAELQSAAFAAWLRNLMVRKVRFELTRPFGHQGLGLTRLPFRHMRILVGREGLGPSVSLMSRVYSPLVSPLTTPTHMVAGEGFEPTYVGL